MAKIVRTNEVDTREEIAKLFTEIFALQAVTENAVVMLMAINTQMPHPGKVVSIYEGGHFYLGVVSKHCEDGLFEVDFLDGDDGCYGVEDLACNAIKKGASDA